MSGDVALADNRYGYERDGSLQRQFEEAAARLREVDGWANPEHGGARELRADLVLEGGGVKGIGLVGAVLVLSEAGYDIRRVGGTSAGAITASIVASLAHSGRDMTALLGYLRSLDFAKFMPDGRLHEMLDHAGGRVASLVADAAILTNREGIYSGEYLEAWLRPILSDLGTRTFADLRLAKDFDPGMSIGEGQDYRLVVYASDITRGHLARLPWDYPLYGQDPDAQDPVRAVRASMSIPFFFEPVHVESRDATVEVNLPGRGPTTVHFAGGIHTWVDGALLAKYPIHSFDRADGAPSRWPTIGVKLSRFQTEYTSTGTHESAIAVAVRCLKTMMNEWDSFVHHQATTDRTIFVDNSELGAMDFNLTRDQQDVLFLNGVRAATNYVISTARARGGPRG